MKHNCFIAPIIATTAILTLGAVAFRAVDISNDAEPSRMETCLASSLIAMKISAQRPQSSQFAVSEEGLQHASYMYQQMCSFCHGAARGREAPFARSFSPRPPQFVIEPSRSPTWKDFYVIRHGIRWTGMPSFQTLSEQDSWHLALYVEGRNQPKE